MSLSTSLIYISLGLSALLQTADFKTHSTSDAQISYPSDWDLDSSGLMNTEFIIFSPFQSDSDEFRENLNLLKEDITGSGLSAQEYGSQSLTLIKQFMNDVKIEKNGVKTVNGVEFYELIYTAKQGLLNLKLVQHMYVKNQTAYVITFTSELTSYKDFDQVGNEILSSFTFKN